MRFEDTLNETVGTIERPLPIPQGSYVMAIKGPGTVLPELRANRWQVLSFPVRIVSPCDDVDPDALEKFGNVTSAFLRKDFMLDTDPAEKSRAQMTLAEVDKFLSVLGMNGMPQKQALAECVGAEFIGTISWRQDKNDAELYYPEIRAFAPVE